MDPDDTLYDELVALKPSMPVSIVIDGDGVVRGVLNGLVRLEKMREAVNEALAGA